MTEAVQLPARRSILSAVASRYHMEPAAFEQTLRRTVFPTAASREHLAAFLLAAYEHDLNPITREIFAFPTKQGGIQVIVSIDGWLKLINRQPELDGFEFDDRTDAQGHIESITCRMFRKDRKHPVEITEYLAECRRNTEVWNHWPRRMLRHRAVIQAARYCFGFSGLGSPVESEQELFDITPAAQAAPAERPAPAAMAQDFVIKALDQFAEDEKAEEQAENKPEAAPEAEQQKPAEESDG